MTPSEMRSTLSHSTAQQEYHTNIVQPRCANRAIIQTCVACPFSAILCQAEMHEDLHKGSNGWCRWSALTCPPWHLDQQFSREAFEIKYNGSSSGLFPHPPMPSELIHQVHQSCQATYPEQNPSSPLQLTPMQPVPYPACAVHTPPHSSATASPRLVNRWPLLSTRPMTCSLLCSTSKLRLGSRSVCLSS